MNIRKAVLTDQEEISKVLMQLITVDDIEKAKKTFTNELDQGIKYLVAEKDGKLLGLVSWFMHGRAKHGLAELNHIVVLEKERRKGVGTGLFKFLVKEIKEDYEEKDSKLRKLFLLTGIRNRNAHEFYKKIGLELEATLKKHFHEDRDEHVYSMFFE